ncbi:uncharacterized protein BT62DRAFT_1013379 [Guyanagaster necrorhizus]|uniref:F-box domain-containing protein n=1 Tax=Guyanagaster necrorhizus TaxID=856835 RepID=A0A9P7VFN3_9AGAR|nr:uncharacterized protein BT62DRAFT_1013379 [Guyanagaster necrorhizus MCA 3950]KAG7439839.1 hypothetical protein BT62DRAFT_1013379 [Guyanagaster necrorhizus MCA 3950]
MITNIGVNILKGEDTPECARTLDAMAEVKREIRLKDRPPVRTDSSQDRLSRPFQDKRLRYSSSRSKTYDNWLDNSCWMNYRKVQRSSNAQLHCLVLNQVVWEPFVNCRDCSGIPFACSMASKSKPSLRPGRGRQRKAVLSIDTHLGSYDRTDPFRAFNVLAGLLGSLASRLGGCQYKLSLHLLMIVEPYIGDESPSRRILITRQPTEILDAIVFHIDSKQDLLSLALSCQRMHDIVVPRHLDYRVLRCKVSSISVWNHLIVNRSLAKNVRRLEILDESRTDTDLESTDDELGMHERQERYLVSALTKMTTLNSFVWSCNHSPISIDNVWPTLLKCHSLSEVRINDNMIFGPTSGEDTQVARSLVLPSVKTASFQSTKHIYGSCQNPELGRIKDMLNHCPNLEDLNISYARPRPPFAAHIPADELFLYGRWPCLTTLTLTNLRGASDAASAFISAHPSLEVLNIDMSPIALYANSLPRLRELTAHKDVVTAILSCPSEEPRPLETIRGARLSGSCDAFLSSLKLFGGSIKKMELRGWNDMDDIRRLVESSPMLSWLDIGKKLSGGQNLAGVVEWANLLTGLPELVAFHGVKFFYEASASVSSTSMADRSRFRKNDEVASLLAWKCAKLRRMDHWEDGLGKVVVLVREKDGAKWKDCFIETSTEAFWTIITYYCSHLHVERRIAELRGLSCERSELERNEVNSFPVLGK